MAPADNTVTEGTAGAAHHPSPAHSLNSSDEAEWVAFFNRTYDNLRIAGMLWGQCREDAEDAASLAMTYVYKRWGEIEHPARYAQRIVRNYVTTVQQHRREEIIRMIKSGLYVEERYDDGGLRALEEEQWVDEILKSLPATQRAVMEGIYEGLSPAEIATHLGRDPATVRKNLQHARERLTKGLRRRHQQETATATAKAWETTR